MNFMKNLQRKFARTGGIPNLMLFITGAMLVVYLLPLFTGNDITTFLTLNRDAVLHGQVWRLLTFVVIPTAGGSLFSVLIALYFLYWVGSSLEQYWGSGSFTFYYLCGMIGAIAAAMITGSGTATYINLSLFLAFAYLFPEMEVLIMFLIPIKVKYLAYVAWVMYALSLITAPWSGKAALIASLINFFLFFGDDFIGWIKNQLRYGKQRRQWKQAMKNNPWNNSPYR